VIVGYCWPNCGRRTPVARPIIVDPIIVTQLLLVIIGPSQWPSDRDNDPIVDNDPLLLTQLLIGIDYWYYWIVLIVIVIGPNWRTDGWHWWPRPSYWQWRTLWVIIIIIDIDCEQTVDWAVTVIIVGNWLLLLVLMTRTQTIVAIDGQTQLVWLDPDGLMTQPSPAQTAQPIIDPMTDGIGNWWLVVLDNYCCIIIIERTLLTDGPRQIDPVILTQAQASIIEGGDGRWPSYWPNPGRPDIIVVVLKRTVSGGRTMTKAHWNCYWPQFIGIVASGHWQPSNDDPANSW